MNIPGNSFSILQGEKGDSGTSRIMVGDSIHLEVCLWSDTGEKRNTFNWNNTLNFQSTFTCMNSFDSGYRLWYSKLEGLWS